MLRNADEERGQGAANIARGQRKGKDHLRHRCNHHHDRGKCHHGRDQRRGAMHSAGNVEKGLASGIGTNERTKV
jgi:hypothetical protein